MPATLHGNAGTSELITQLPVEIDRSPDGVIVRRPYQCDRDSVETLLASAPQYGESDIDFPTSILKKIVETKGPKFSRLVFIFAPESLSIGGGSGSRPIGSVRRRTRTLANQFPIEQHPSWSQSWAYTKPGQRTYIQYETSYVREEVIDASDFDWTEDNVKSGVGTRDAPTDLTNPTSNAWLKVDRSVEEYDSTVILREEWALNQNTWDTDVYS